jgi:hypothetical protein
MTSKRLTLIVLICIGVLLGAWLVRYFSPEQVIRRQILATVESFENEQILGVATTISRSYRDDWGMSYESILGYVQEVMTTFSDLAVDLEPPVVEVDGGSARVRLRFVVSGTAEGRRGYVIGSPGDPVTTTQLWRKEPAGWRVVTTEALDIPELRDELDRMRSRS